MVISYFFPTAISPGVFVMYSNTKTQSYHPPVEILQFSHCLESECLIEFILGFVMAISSTVGFLTRVRKGLEAFKKWSGTLNSRSPDCSRLSYCLEEEKTVALKLHLCPLHGGSIRVEESPCTFMMNEQALRSVLVWPHPCFPLPLCRPQWALHRKDLQGLPAWLVPGISNDLHA